MEGSRSGKPWISYELRGFDVREPHVFDVTQFDWVKSLEAQWSVIRDELLAVVGHDEVFLTYPDAGMTSRKGAWKTAGMLYWTFRSDKYASMFPNTWKILQSVPNLTSASFLLLEPNSTIKPHYGDTNAVVRCHMGLVVPAPAPRCGLRVKDHTFSWEEGRIFMFNDAHEHTAWNNTNQNRFILSFDVMRPEFLGQETWAASHVLGKIFFDVHYQRQAWMRWVARSATGEKALRTSCMLLFRTLIALKLPLFNLL